MDEEISGAINCATKILDINFELKSFQKDVVTQFAKGKDCFCIAPTGSGKSLTFRMAPYVIDWMLGYRQRDYIKSLKCQIQSHFYRVFSWSLKHNII